MTSFLVIVRSLHLSAQQVAGSANTSPGGFLMLHTVSASAHTFIYSTSALRMSRRSTEAPSTCHSGRTQSAKRFLCLKDSQIERGPVRGPKDFSPLRPHVVRQWVSGLKIKGASTRGLKVSAIDPKFSWRRSQCRGC